MTDIRDFKAPSWATGWCPRCEFTATCHDCRFRAGVDLPYRASA